MYQNSDVWDGDFVFFSKPSSAKISVIMAQINLTKNAGKAREGYHKTVYFAVKDSICNAHELKLSWLIVSILEEWLVFYSDLREIPKTS